MHIGLSLLFAAYNSPAMDPGSPATTLVSCSSTLSATQTDGVHVESSADVLFAVQKTFVQDPRVQVPSPEVARELRAMNETRVKVGTLVRQHRFGDAYAEVSAYRLRHLGWNDGTDDQFITCLLLTGRYKQAHSEVQRVLGTRGHGNDFLRLELVLASGATNQVEAGQSEFCQRCLRSYFHEENPLETFPSRVTNLRGRKGLMVLSCLALGMQNSYASTAFSELALHFEPRNEMAGRRAIQMYEYQGSFSNVRRIAKQLATSLESGAAKDYFLNKYKASEGQPHRSQPVGSPVP